MKRCGIYTRKSSDEGLDQHFNSLDAQREACEAYVLSQVGERWSALPTRYDDGGFSGGSMERPALKRLLADISRGLVDVVVVYKIDRLTRSLADFARMVEQFDARYVSFVSVTQAFNTTSSMGRLTLNVLLSFAQFEREVTGERIRDKIAASKAKGLWMGGLTPMGYDLPADGTRVLQVNEIEAATVRHIFDRYLAVRSVHRLLDELERDGVRSKKRISAKGKVSGGQRLSRGAMFHLLQNRVYTGAIVHKGVCHAGQHASILDPTVFDAVQAIMNEHKKKRRHTTSGRSTLTGKLYDADGNKLTPTHSRGARGITYRYYVASCLQQGKRTAGKAQRYSAQRVDRIIGSAIGRIGLAGELTEKLLRAKLSPQSLELSLEAALADKVALVLEEGEQLTTDGEVLRWTIAAMLKPRGGRAKVQPVRHDAPQRDSVLINALGAAHRLVQRDEVGLPFVTQIPKAQYQARLMRLAFLSPSIQRDILAGRQPPRLRLEDLVRAPVPLCWKAQERLIRRLSSKG